MSRDGISVGTGRQGHSRRSQPHSTPSAKTNGAGTFGNGFLPNVVETNDFLHRIFRKYLKRVALIPTEV